MENLTNCHGCLNNTSKQVLTIFNFQTEDSPFLAGNATFLVMPNPYAHTTNATDYLDLITWFNFVVTDDGKFDNDPTPGIIELVGVNNGTYSIMQIKGNPGFGMAPHPEASDEILGTTGFSYVTQTFVNFTATTLTTIEPPHIDDMTFNNLKNKGARIKGVQISSTNDLPPAVMVNRGQKLTSTPPDHLVFTTNFAPNTTPDTIFTALSIPTYAVPKDAVDSGSLFFVPPVFVAPATGGGKFLMTPILEEVSLGTNIVLRFDEVDQGAKHALVEAIELPMNAQGTNIGVSLMVDTSNPSGVPIPSGNVQIYLNFEEAGDIDFSDPTAYSDNPTIHFNLEKDGISCPDGVVVYLLDSGHWHEVTPGPTRNPSGDTTHICAYSIDVEHFSSYLVGSDSVGGHGHNVGHTSGSHEQHSTPHSSHSSHAHVAGEHGEHASGYYIITKDLNIFEIQYDLNNAVAKILIGTTGNIHDVEVQIYSVMGGKRMAHLVKEQQAQLFRFDDKTMKKYLFEVPLDPNEVFFRVSVEDRNYNLNQSVKIDGLVGRVIPWFANIYENATHGEHNDEHESNISETGFEIKFDGGKKIVSYNGIEFLIKYEMAGAITGIEVNEESRTVSFLLDSVAGGELLLQVPRSLVNAIDDNFVVMVSTSPPTEIAYEVTSSTPDYYTLRVTLPKGATNLTIIGSSVVPEFGLMALLVLSLAIIPLVYVRKSSVGL
jgi:predicted secreted protein with PEFG-CTERM motif